MTAYDPVPCGQFLWHGHGRMANDTDYTDGLRLASRLRHSSSKRKRFNSPRVIPAMTTSDAVESRAISRSIFHSSSIFPSIWRGIRVWRRKFLSCAHRFVTICVKFRFVRRLELIILDGRFIHLWVASFIKASFVLAAANKLKT